MDIASNDNVIKPASKWHLPRRVNWLILSIVFQSLGIGFLTILISAYLPQIGYAPGSVGLILGLFGLTLVVTGIPFGILSDRAGRKKLILISSLGFPVSMLLLALAPSLNYLLFSAIILGVSEAASLTTWNAIIADLTTKDNRNEAFSLSFIVNILSIGAGSAIPLAFPTLQRLLALSVIVIHRDSMIVLSGVALLTPLIIVVALRDYRQGAGEEEEMGRGKNLGVLLKFSGINGLIGFGGGLIIPLIPTWFYLKFAVPDTYSGPLLAIASIIIGFTSLFGPRLAARFGQLNSIALMEGFAAFFLVALAFAISPILAAVLYVGRAVSMNTASPLSDSYLMGIISREERGLASAINTIIFRLPNSVSTIAGGLILATGSYDLPFLLAGGFYAVSVGLLYSTFRNIRPVT